MYGPRFEHGDDDFRGRRGRYGNDPYYRPSSLPPPPRGRQHQRWHSGGPAPPFGPQFGGPMPLHALEGPGPPGEQLYPDLTRPPNELPSPPSSSGFEDSLGFGDLIIAQRAIDEERAQLFADEELPNGLLETERVFKIPAISKVSTHGKARWTSRAQGHIMRNVWSDTCFAGMIFGLVVWFGCTVYAETRARDHIGKQERHHVRIGALVAGAIAAGTQLFLAVAELMRPRCWRLFNIMRCDKDLEAYGHGWFMFSFAATRWAVFIATVGWAATWSVGQYMYMQEASAHNQCRQELIVVMNSGAGSAMGPPIAPPPP
ncbi:hypothetical protein DRE_02796 [Drechslerella stenobrocha 248]|uniref:Uncharacterized protein n=1 Tax=Drechslerella stenobrocha 248 TaxID=1043628 RepID=W7HWI9_9PEZI|nr:hypothetical protein DRE_02796 [Drechslerella stenobrocha 248]